MKSFYLNVNNSGFSESNNTITNKVFKARELEQFLVYQVIIYVFGVIIFLSNITVVISSGLLLKKDQHRKSTYLLLGNLSLADMFIGLFLIIGVSMENTMSYDPLCIYQAGIIVCPAVVSIFTVGLIAVDRYIYILHGLYYQKWFTTTKVRIGILCIWVIGITLAFMPACGLVNTELNHSRCVYLTLFPGALILLHSFLSIVPIVLVAVLYSIILIRALKNVREIKATIKNVGTNSKDNELRIHIGDANLKKFAQTVKYPGASKIIKLHRSVSFNEKYNCIKVKPEISNICRKSKSIENLNKGITFEDSKIEIQNNRSSYDSEFSIYSIISRTAEVNSSIIEIGGHKNNKSIFKSSNSKNISKVKEPNKWRAIIVVMLTSGSFIFTLTPLFITAILYVFCQEKLTNPRCKHLKMMLNGPIVTLAGINSILNPMIYAWWHKGFQRNIRIYFRRYVLHFFQNFTF